MIQDVTSLLTFLFETTLDFLSSAPIVYLVYILIIFCTVRLLFYFLGFDDFKRR